MKWNEKIPDVSQWRPDTDPKENLASGLLLTCQAAQSRIVSEAAIERQFNINNFDSGLGVEDIVRQEFAKLLPDRYSVDVGVVNDTMGGTAGENDVLIRDAKWAPVVKLGATPASRRFHFPIESIYASIEVKQTLGFQQLDDAMAKLVRISRLHRPQNPYGHITENQHIQDFDKEGFVLNPLHTTVFGVGIHRDVSFRELAMRFGAINASLERDEMVNELCILGSGVAMYMTKDAQASYREATFMQDRQESLVMAIYDDEPDSAFYLLFVHVLGHLTRSVLAVHDIHRRYGSIRATDDFIPWNDARFNLG